MYLFDFECQWCWWKEKIESLLEYRHNPLVVTATTEMNLAPSGFNTFIDYSRFIKNKNKIKKKNKNVSSLRRGARGWDRSMGHLHCTSPRDAKVNKHMTKWSARNSPLSWDSLIWADCLRFESSQGTQIVIFLLSPSYIWYHFLFCDPTCPLRFKCLSLKHYPQPEKKNECLKDDLCC